MDALIAAQSDWLTLRATLAGLLTGPDGNAGFVPAIEQLALELGRRVRADSDGALFGIMRLDQGDYGITHALRSAVICGVFGRTLGWGEAEALSASAAALTMNIAMLDLQRQLWAQLEPPTPGQLEAIRSHPARGAAQLERLGVRDALWLRTVAEHHESADGNGYPSGTSSPCATAAALALADRYCAKISRRQHRPALTPEAAVHELHRIGSGQSRQAVDSIVQAVGLYPPGTMVELANGETAVMATRPAPGRAATAYAVRNAQGDDISPTLRDTGRTEFSVRCTARQDSADGGNAPRQQRSGMA